MATGGSNIVESFTTEEVTTPQTSFNSIRLKYSRSEFTVCAADGAIYGVAFAGDEVFAAQIAKVIVCDIVNNTLKRQFYLPMLREPFDIAVHPITKTIYVSDTELEVIHRIDAHGTLLPCINLEDNKPAGITMSRKNTLLVVIPKKNLLLEIGAAGVLRRILVPLPTLQSPIKIIELLDGSHVITYGFNPIFRDGLCLYNSDWNLVEQYGLVAPHEEIKTPISAAVDDSTGAIYVADFNGHRVLVFDKNLDLIGELNISITIPQPNTLCFDQVKRRLYIGCVKYILMIQIRPLTSLVGAKSSCCVLL